MTPVERELFFELLKKFKEEKRSKESVSFQRQLEFLAILVLLLFFLLVVLRMT